MHQLIDEPGVLVIIEKRAKNMVGRDAKLLADQDQRRGRDPVGALLVFLQLLERDPELFGKRSLRHAPQQPEFPNAGAYLLINVRGLDFQTLSHAPPFHCRKFRILPSIGPRLGSSSTRGPRILGRPGGGSDEEAGQIEASEAAPHHLPHSSPFNAHLRLPLPVFLSICPSLRSMVEITVLYVNIVFDQIGNYHPAVVTTSEYKAALAALGTGFKWPQNPCE